MSRRSSGASTGSDEAVSSEALKALSPIAELVDRISTKKVSDSKLLGTEIDKICKDDQEVLVRSFTGPDFPDKLLIDAVLELSPERWDLVQTVLSKYTLEQHQQYIVRCMSIQSEAAAHNQKPLYVLKLAISELVKRKGSGKKPLDFTFKGQNNETISFLYALITYNLSEVVAWVFSGDKKPVLKHMQIVANEVVAEGTDEEAVYDDIASSSDDWPEIIFPGAKNQPSLQLKDVTPTMVILIDQIRKNLGLAILTDKEQDRLGVLVAKNGRSYAENQRLRAALDETVWQEATDAQSVKIHMNSYSNSGKSIGDKATKERLAFKRLGVSGLMQIIQEEDPITSNSAPVNSAIDDFLTAIPVENRQKCRDLLAPVRLVAKERNKHITRFENSADKDLPAKEHRTEALTWIADLAEKNDAEVDSTLKTLLQKKGKYTRSERSQIQSLLEAFGHDEAANNEAVALLEQGERPDTEIDTIIKMMHKQNARTPDEEDELLVLFKNADQQLRTSLEGSAPTVAAEMINSLKVHELELSKVKGVFSPKPKDDQAIAKLREMLELFIKLDADGSLRAETHELKIPIQQGVMRIPQRSFNSIVMDTFTNPVVFAGIIQMQDPAVMGLVNYLFARSKSAQAERQASGLADVVLKKFAAVDGKNYVTWVQYLIDKVGLGGIKPDFLTALAEAGMPFNDIKYTADLQALFKENPAYCVAILAGVSHEAQSSLVYYFATQRDLKARTSQLTQLMKSASAGQNEMVTACIVKWLRVLSSGNDSILDVMAEIVTELPNVFGAEKLMLEKRAISINQAVSVFPSMGAVKVWRRAAKKVVGGGSGEEASDDESDGKDNYAVLDFVTAGLAEDQCVYSNVVTGISPDDIERLRNGDWDDFERVLLAFKNKASNGELDFKPIEQQRALLDFVIKARLAEKPEEESKYQALLEKIQGDADEADRESVAFDISIKDVNRRSQAMSGHADASPGMAAADQQAEGGVTFTIKRTNPEVRPGRQGGLGGASAVFKEKAPVPRERGGSSTMPSLAAAAEQ